MAGLQFFIRTVISKCCYPDSFHWLNLLGLGQCHAKVPLSCLKCF